MLSGKTVLITGASSGLGRSLALELARGHANLVLFSRNLENLRKTETLCSEFNASSISFAGDVGKAEECKKAIEITIERFGKLDVLIANAGIGMWAKFEQIEDLTILHKIMASNYLGAVNCTYHALPHLRKSKGSIAVISSIQGKQAVPFHTGYSASKHALQGFFDSLRIELADSGVDILIAQPSWIRGTDWRKNTLGMNGQPIGGLRRKHDTEALSVQKCAQAIVKAIAERKRELVMPPQLKILPWLNLINPRIVEFFIKRKLQE